VQNYAFLHTVSNASLALAIPKCAAAGLSVAFLIAGHRPPGLHTGQIL